MLNGDLFHPQTRKNILHTHCSPQFQQNLNRKLVLEASQETTKKPKQLNQTSWRRRRMGEEDRLPFRPEARMPTTSP